jgi:hypothetical protein
MPDLNGVLSSSEKQKIMDWVKSKARMRIECPLCLSNNWTVANHVVAPSVVNGSAVGMGAYPYPQAMLISECGYTLFVNLVVVGIFPKDGSS